MKAILRVLLAMAFFLPAVAVNANSIGVAGTFNGLKWILSNNSPALSTCTVAYMDLITDMSNPAAMGIHGYLVCDSGTTAIGVMGTLFRLNSTQYLVTMYVGAASGAFSCTLSSANLSGSCTAYSAAGSNVGTGYLTLF